MADKTSIEWTDTTWNCLTGCTPVSHGCTNCYAAQLSATRLKDTPRYKGLAVLNSRGQGVFNGVVRMHEDKLLEPLKWRTPRRVFVNSMSDVFHEAVPFEFIDKMFAVMALCPQHTFQILTKRPERMAEYFAPGNRGDIIWGNMVRLSKRDLTEADSLAFSQCPTNVWLGTSVEDQTTANERIRWLTKCPSLVRFLSSEPLIGPVDLTRLDHGGIFGEVDVTHGRIMSAGAMSRVEHPILHWVIVGGESGPHARPMDMDWARSLRDQCTAAGIAFFFKQVGGNRPKSNGRLLDGRTWDEYPEQS